MEYEYIVKVYRPDNQKDCMNTFEGEFEIQLFILFFFKES